MKPHLVIIGAGFAGLTLARALKRADLRITICDRNNHHLFQPLLYQVATAGLSPADIASPVRSVLRRDRETEVLMAELASVDLAKKTVHLHPNLNLHYDYLVIATGASTNYFGHPEWEKFAPSLKSLADATSIRNRILLAFEKAELASSAEERTQYLTFILVGGGPTGVELAGAISELARRAMASDFRHIEPKQCRVILIEAASRLLTSFSEDLSAKAKRDLENMGVEVLLNTRVEDIQENKVKIAQEFIPSRNIIWTAGVQATPIGKTLGAQCDQAGRIIVKEDLSIPNHPDVFIAGDLAHSADTKTKMPLPGVAPVAIQQGKYLAKLIRSKIENRKYPGPFRYIDKGNLATIGRSKAVAQFAHLHVSGFFAWVLWLGVHIIYLIGFRNRILVLIQWAYSYFTFQRGARLINEPKSSAISR